jgi:hypothetical protein
MLKKESFFAAGKNQRRFNKPDGKKRKAASNHPQAIPSP